ncbi:MAG: hypothetical protein A3E54_00125 [Gammaproteobacteria bacterium RIFCSPHIGHO2_12_FULL_41_25]|nr:MAG: hypothetical protein A3B71_00295 [Gammaproteobacteria bacterium RIFCSPHIGHO2_02_FULL_42_43]OGT28850.1 MAG: hypothetical protein A2624_04370 [Gammaproteobacteria bacterium RIFCSPHIGHO2_01_FULL_42_8]OGT50974.1 MAG: hypothetical protein A3E54_00125 [Gammaproteobacteria bacterium RIFCSPHIGHO2_12_FULL_41_25]OGT85655.1 MAG: hypothetical protein A3G86_00125 [Gammaproteobacteria bacterium RIFCSPLOWO2_12_FULL_42_18]
MPVSRSASRDAPHFTVIELVMFWLLSDKVSAKAVALSSAAVLIIPIIIFFIQKLRVSAEVSAENKISIFG